MALLTIETLEKLDIEIGRIMGLVKDPKYSSLAEDYELNMAQCLLWLDITQLLGYMLDKNDYEDIDCDHDELGLVAKKLLALKEDKFMYFKRLLAQYDILHDNTAVGKILDESIQDINEIYQSIEKDLSSILTTQSEIRKMIEE